MATGYVNQASKTRFWYGRGANKSWRLQHHHGSDTMGFSGYLGLLIVLAWALGDFD